MSLQLTMDQGDKSIQMWNFCRDKGDKKSK